MLIKVAIKIMFSAMRIRKKPFHYTSHEVKMCNSCYACCIEKKLYWRQLRVRNLLQRRLITIAMPQAQLLNS